MASDAQGSVPRKHRRSSSNESEGPPKRRRHRHHHRHHRRSSRKHIEEGARGREEIENKDDKTKNDGRDGITLPLLVSVFSAPNLRPDYDKEEGEIVEEEDLDGGYADFRSKTRESDDEFVEMKATQLHGESDTYNVTVHEVQDVVGRNSVPPIESNLDRRSQDSKTVAEDMSSDEVLICAAVHSKESVTTDYKINLEAGIWKNSSTELNTRDFGCDSAEHCKDNNRPHNGSGSPGKGGSKWKRYCDDGSDIRDWRKSLSLESMGDRHKAPACLPSHDGFREEVHSLKRSRRLHQSRERYSSQSILPGASHLKATYQQDACKEVRKTMSDSDDEYNVEHRHASRDLLRDKEGERSSSYGRYSGLVDKHHSWEHQGIDRMGSHETWDGDLEGTRKTQDREGKELDWDRKREKERAQARERERARGREMDWDRESKRERERERERARDKDRDRDKDRGRNRDRDKFGNKFGRLHKHENIGDGSGSRESQNDARHRTRVEMGHSNRRNENESEKACSSKDHYSGEDETKPRRDKDEPEDYEERTALQLSDQEDEDLNRIKEESKRRREAILEKYKARQLQQQHESHLEGADKKHVELPSLPAVSVSVVAGVTDAQGEGTDISVAEPSFSLGKAPPQNGVSAFGKTSNAGGLGEGTPKSERSNDMFCDDMFGESPAGVRKPGKGDGLAIETSGLHDNWDDAEGYYRYRIGERLDGRYEVTAAHGKGVFSTVVRARDLKAGAGDPAEVAIKIIRNNETMYKAGLEELVILKKLAGADPENRRHCVLFLSSFKYRNHLCLVFESLHMNLREVLKKFGRNIGLKLTAVRAYAKQLFIALKHLRNCGVLHCDMKPDNILVNEAKNVLKLCDFGNAMFAGKNEITPYLVSRFYRAPEIILGLPYDHPMDIWSVGCCLFELHIGKVLFPGPTNNDMLRLHMELKGPFPKKMLRKGAFTDQHFDQDLNFLSSEEDVVTKKAIKRLILNIKPKDIGSIVTSSPGEDPKMLANFKDLLEKIFVLDPDKRITVSQALSHPFITGK